VSAAAFSLVLNLLLVPALFMAYLDVIRSRLLTAAAVALEKLLGPRVLSEMIRHNAAPGSGERGRTG